MAEQPAIRRLHVGCGPHHHLADWWNVDIRSFPGVDQVFDVTMPWPWTSLELVYAEHFLEHLGPSDAVRFLSSAHSALGRDGRIRLSTPGLEWVLRSHFSFEDDPDAARSETFATNRAFHGWGHRFLYSRATLRWVLEGVGFRQIQFFEYGESDTEALRGIEKHGGYSVREGYPSVWIAEGRAQGQPVSVDAAVESEIREHFERYVQAGH